MAKLARQRARKSRSSQCRVNSLFGSADRQEGYLPLSRVLLVDDNSDTLEMLETVLRLDDFDVVSRLNAADALALLPDGFDAICTDLSMPGGLDGFDFIRAVRASSPSIPIVVVSGQPPEQVRDRARGLGSCRFLSKGHEPDELAHILRFLIDTCRGACATCANRGLSCE
jgi:CheY-like chemotaxis protein